MKRGRGLTLWVAAGVAGVVLLAALYSRAFPFLPRHWTISSDEAVAIALGVFGCLTVAMLLLAVFNDKGAVAVYDQSLKLQVVEKENQNLIAENKSINEENHALQSDPAAIEKIARLHPGPHG